ncbi:hypothetical protein ThvES_00002120 [Thiovulum sp. ES]|nr:hypothetical protein ThvES_00002120 [Thiovulum sp. ES]
MKPLFLLTFIISSFLSANTLCQNKLFKSLYLADGEKRTWVIDDEQAVLFSTKVPYKLEIIRSVPQFGVYFVSHGLKLGKDSLPLKIRQVRNNIRFVMDDKNYYAGRMIQKQIASIPALFSQEVSPNSLVFSGCCVMTGISLGGNKYVSAQFVERASKNDQKYLSDIGARFVKDGNDIYIYRVNPFFTDNPFEEGDRLIFLNGEKYADLEKLQLDIMFSENYADMKMTIERNGEVLDVQTKSMPYYGGGVLGDTFLESLGIWFDDKLNILHLKMISPFLKRGVKKNSRLVAIDNQKVETMEDVQDYFSSLKSDMPNYFIFYFVEGERQMSAYMKVNKELFSSDAKVDNVDLSKFIGKQPKKFFIEERREARDIFSNFDGLKIRKYLGD